MMEIKPVKRYQPPKYASYEYFLAHPELLKKVPERWRGNKLVLLATSTLALFISGCSESTFEGGMQIPPFISEEQAKSIIRNEAANAGITFQSDSLTIDSVRIPIHRYIQNGLDTLTLTPFTQFTFDGYDTTHHISYEYVSSDDMHVWLQLDTTQSYNGYRMDSTAIGLQNQLRTTHSELHTGVFYDLAADEADLRRQVQEFIAWLRAEGII